MSKVKRSKTGKWTNLSRQVSYQTRLQINDDDDDDDDADRDVIVRSISIEDRSSCP